MSPLEEQRRSTERQLWADCVEKVPRQPHEAFWYDHATGGALKSLAFIVAMP